MSYVFVDNKKIKPNVFVEDIEKLTEEEWLAKRRFGIGGSDCPKIFGLDSFTSPLELYYDKIGKKVFEEEAAEDTIARDIGHALESIALRVFESKNPEFEVFTRREMFQHPKYTFMLADCDAFCKHKETGEIYGIEVKTTSQENMSLSWGRAQDNRYPKKYEMQVRHYMAVTGIEKFFLICLATNTASGYRQRLIERDLELEKEIIDTEAGFWNMNVSFEIPPIDEEDDKNLEILKNQFAKVDERETKNYNDDAEMSQLVAEYLKKKQERAEEEAKAKALKKAEDQLLAEIVEKTEGNNGTLNLGGTAYNITWSSKETKSIPAANLAPLLAAFPNAKEYIKEGATTSVTVKEAKQSA